MIPFFHLDSLIPLNVCGGAKVVQKTLERMFLFRLSYRMKFHGAESLSSIHPFDCRIRMVRLFLVHVVVLSVDVSCPLATWLLWGCWPCFRWKLRVICVGPENWHFWKPCWPRIAFHSPAGFSYDSLCFGFVTIYISGFSSIESEWKTFWRETSNQVFFKSHPDFRLFVLKKSTFSRARTVHV